VAWNPAAIVVVTPTGSNINRMPHPEQVAVHVPEFPTAELAHPLQARRGDTRHGRASISSMRRTRRRLNIRLTKEKIRDHTHEGLKRMIITIQAISEAGSRWAAKSTRADYRDGDQEKQERSQRGEERVFIQA